MNPPVFDLLRTVVHERFGGSVTRLAEACGVSIQLASKWVAEDPRKRVTPGPASCEKIADALGYDPDYILELAGHRRQRGQPTQLDPRLAAFLATIEAGWLAMDEATRDLAERTARVLFSTHADNRRQREKDRNSNGPVILHQGPSILARSLAVAFSPLVG
jgi:transcriptional regulator with XRE-family HTH domain